jgi:proteasome lid subunit RPN8/RPN11
MHDDLSLDSKSCVAGVRRVIPFWHLPEVKGYRFAMTDVLEIDDGRSVSTVSVSDLASHPDLITDASDLDRRRTPAVPVSALMELDIDGPRPWVLVESTDGYRASIPAEELHRGGYLLVSLPGRPSDVGSDGPFRLIVEDGQTLCWNVKRVGSLRATTHRQPDSVPDDPPH